MAHIDPSYPEMWEKSWYEPDEGVIAHSKCLYFSHIWKKPDEHHSLSGQLAIGLRLEHPKMSCIIVVFHNWYREMNNSTDSITENGFEWEILPFKFENMRDTPRIVAHVPRDWSCSLRFWSYFFTSLANRINSTYGAVSATAQSHKSCRLTSNLLRTPIAIAPLDLAIVHELNNDFISPAVYFLSSRDPGHGLIASPTRYVS
jgi:hypothetical protein